MALNIFMHDLYFSARSNSLYNYAGDNTLLATGNSVMCEGNFWPYAHISPLAGAPIVMFVNIRKTCNFDKPLNNVLKSWMAHILLLRHQKFKTHN